MEEKVMVVCEYFEYAIFRDENGERKEMHFDSTQPKFAALTGDVSSADKNIERIKSIVEKDTIADAVMVVIYQMVMSQDGFDKLSKMFSKLSEEQLILDIFKQNLYNGGIMVKAVVPFVFPNRISDRKFVS